MGGCKSKSAESRELSTFRKEALQKHNEYRSQHGAPILKMNSRLNKMAQEWAEHIANTGTLEHSDKKIREIKGEYVGENIYHKMFSSNDSSAIKNYNFCGADCVKTWYDEKDKYDYNNPGFSNDTGHFTQLMWKGTRELGIGCVTLRKDNRVDYYIVGYYLPGGNINSPTEFKENVLPEK